MNEAVIGLDVGGANIKYCCNAGGSGSIPFNLWQHPHLLPDILQDIPAWNQADCFAVTMTGELADCFESRSRGVASICNLVHAAVGNRDVYFYQTNGQFVNIANAIENWQLTAASNWHALAALVATVAPDCLVIDIGSTTIDLIPVSNGKLVNHGSTDLSRLAAGELLYSGVIRSPVCSIVQSVELNGCQIPVAQELFANALDVYLILERIPEQTSCTRRTADGRAATKEKSFQRLARMLCSDANELGEAALTSIARQIANRQLSLIREAVNRIIQRHPGIDCVAAIGEGAFLLDQIFDDGHAAIHRLDNDAIVQRFDASHRPAGISTACSVAFLYQRQSLLATNGANS